MMKITNYITGVLAIIALMSISCEKSDYTVLSHTDDNLSLIIRLDNILNSRGFIKGTIKIQNKTNKTLKININDILITYNDIVCSMYRDSIASLYYIINVEPLSKIEEKIYLAFNNKPIKKNKKFNKEIFQLTIRDSIK